MVDQAYPGQAHLVAADERQSGCWREDYSSLRLFLNAEAHCLICSFQAKRSAAWAYWRWLILFAVFSSTSYYVAFIII